MKFTIPIAVILLFGSFSASAQDHEIDETRLFYRSEMYGGLLIHSHGWGGNFRKVKNITGFKKRLLEIETVNRKHAKEQKSFNPQYDDTKGYVYGKLNAMFILRAGIGKQKVVYSKETKRGVQISYLFAGGASIGLAKPVYLEIQRQSSTGSNIIRSTEKYDPEEHSQDVIYGRAPMLKGAEETRIYPGAYGRLALNFEYAPGDAAIRAFETGLTVDVYHTEVPIMAFTSNNQAFLSLYLSWQFGKKSY